MPQASFCLSLSPDLFCGSRLPIPSWYSCTSEWGLGTRKKSRCCHSALGHPRRVYLHFPTCPHPIIWHWSQQTRGSHGWHSRLGYYAPHSALRIQNLREREIKGGNVLFYPPWTKGILQHRLGIPSSKKYQCYFLYARTGVNFSAACALVCVCVWVYVLCVCVCSVCNWSLLFIEPRFASLYQMFSL